VIKRGHILEFLNIPYIQFCRESIALQNALGSTH
jgi:hypothetical protein